MVIFKKGDPVRVTDEWWAKRCRPGMFMSPPDVERRDFVCEEFVPYLPRDRGSEGGAINLVGVDTQFMGCVFEAGTGPW